MDAIQTTKPITLCLVCGQINQHIAGCPEADKSRQDRPWNRISKVVVNGRKAGRNSRVER